MKEDFIKVFRGNFSQEELEAEFVPSKYRICDIRMIAGPKGNTIVFGLEIPGAIFHNLTIKNGKHGRFIGFPSKAYTNDAGFTKYFPHYELALPQCVQQEIMREVAARMQEGDSGFCGQEFRENHKKQFD